VIINGQHVEVRGVSGK